MNKVIILTGPTASGKSSLGIEYAQKFGNIDIINADSMQVYSGNKITSAQPSDAEMGLVSHKMYGFLDGNDSLSVGRWIKMIDEEIKNSHKQGRLPLLIGGSSMYIRFLVNGLSEIPNISEKVKKEANLKLAELGNEDFFESLINIGAITKNSHIVPNDTQRTLRAYCVKIETQKPLHDWQSSGISILTDYDVKKIVLLPQRDIIYKACNNRFIDQISNGGIEEVEVLLKMNYSKELSIMKSIGVPQISNYLKGIWSKELMIEKAQQHTRNYAKRQITWFKNKFDDFSFLDTKCLNGFMKFIK